jgi:hypothetical protein
VLVPRDGGGAARPLKVCVDSALGQDLAARLRRAANLP